MSAAPRDSDGLGVCQARTPRCAACPCVCQHTGCNYPESECSGACDASLQAQERAHQERRAADCMTVASFCFLGLIGFVAVGIVIAASGLLAGLLFG